MAKPSASCRRATKRSSRRRCRRRRPVSRHGTQRRWPTRAAALERAGDLIEQNRGRLIALLQSEGGKTLDDCVSEVREAADFCRYYASAGAPHAGAAAAAGADRREQRVALSRPRRLRLHQPVEFSAGDFHRPDRWRARRRQCAWWPSPPNRRRSIAYEAVKLLHAAGVPASALHLVPGDGKIGAMLTGHASVAGVAFTGSTEVARIINRTLAAKRRTDPAADRRDRRHQCHDRRRHRAAGAGDRRRRSPRPSAPPASAARRLRLLCVQDDVADRVLEMVEGAARELDARRSARSGNPGRSGDRRRGQGQARALDRGHGRARRAALPLGGSRCRRAALMSRRRSSNSIAQNELKEEVFGPVLHVVRWRADELDQLLDDLAGNGTALTLGIHSRIDATVERIVARLAARQCLRQPQHDRRGGRQPAVRRQRTCPAPGRRPAARIICTASRSNRW